MMGDDDKDYSYCSHITKTVWLDKCNSVRKLDFNPKDKIRAALRIASKNNIPPMKLQILKQRNPDLHKIIAKAYDGKYI